MVDHPQKLQMENHMTKDGCLTMDGYSSENQWMVFHPILDCLWRIRKSCDWFNDWGSCTMQRETGAEVNQHQLL